MGMVMKDARLVKVTCYETTNQWLVAYDVHTELCLHVWRTEVEVLKWYARENIE
jgi:hypothetical protein